MLDIRFIRDNVDLMKETVQKKMIKLDIDELLSVDDKRRELISKQEALRAKQNAANESIAQASGEQKKTLIAGMKEIAEQVSSIKDELNSVEQTFHALMLKVPQIPLADTPVGDESANTVVRSHGEAPTFDFEPKDHLAIAEALDGIDVERGVKLMGTRGYILKNDVARLEMALANYALDFLRERGFTQLAVPVIAKARFFEGTGHFPFAEQETFKVLDQRNDEDSQLYLIGTSEVPLCGYHADEILDASSLPLRYTAATNCFRTEVGSYGRDTRGLYRVKQFTKVEQVILCENNLETSTQLLKEIVANAETFIQSLEIPYRVLRIATGDMGAGKVEMYDIESWMPSRCKYGETHSASNLGDWQARRSNLRYQAGKEKKYCHTLNNTLMASPRLLIPLLENHQRADGSVYLPKALRPYMGGMDSLKPRQK